jgi:folate-binding protein YgfZ
MPVISGKALSEIQQARERAALFDLSHWGKLEARGPDAASFLHNLCTNDILRLAPGTGCEAFFTTAQAKVVSLAHVFNLPATDGTKTFWLGLAPGKNEALAKHLNYYLITEQVELLDRTTEFAQFHLAGPGAQAVLNRAWGSVGLNLFQVVQQDVDSALPGQIRRTDSLGLLGFDIMVPTSAAESVRNSLLTAGAQPAGPDALEILRIEAGMPLDGVDIDETALPQEIGRTEKAISFTKGCYIGQETVARIRTYGHVNRQVVGLQITGESPISRGAHLLRDGKDVGQITSSVWSPLMGTVIALAMVRRGSEEPKTPLQVVEADGERSAQVVALPFAESYTVNPAG